MTSNCAGHKDRNCCHIGMDRVMSAMPSCSISRSVEEPFGALVTAFSARLRELQSVALLRIDGAQHAASTHPSPARSLLDGLPGAAQSQRRSSLHRTWRSLRYALSSERTPLSFLHRTVKSAQVHTGKRTRLGAQAAGNPWLCRARTAGNPKGIQLSARSSALQCRTSSLLQN